MNQAFLLTNLICENILSSQDTWILVEGLQANQGGYIPELFNLIYIYTVPVLLKKFQGITNN